MANLESWLYEGWDIHTSYPKYGTTVIWRTWQNGDTKSFAVLDDRAELLWSKDYLERDFKAKYQPTYEDVWLYIAGLHEDMEKLLSSLN